MTNLERWSGFSMKSVGVAVNSWPECSLSALVSFIDLYSSQMFPKFSQDIVAAF